uniref:lysozyme n=1 Tax=Branchiostoma belcheri tsingtauense TaxID=155462 RepID=Q86QP2_BRABE|nr:lysozyme precursor [Branchiostoma belcheri tsingtauense]
MFLAVVLLMGVVCTAHAKTYEKCELARELVSRGLTTRSQAGEWICLVQHESSFRTGALGGPNGDGSYDHELFQINDYYWCDDGGPHNDCGVSCSALRDNNIADDVRCAKLIYQRHGFNAWYGWINHCQGHNNANLVTSCW